MLGSLRPSLSLSLCAGTVDRRVEAPWSDGPHVPSTGLNPTRTSTFLLAVPDDKVVALYGLRGGVCTHILREKGKHYHDCPRICTVSDRRMTTSQVEPRRDTKNAFISTSFEHDFLRHGRVVHHQLTLTRPPRCRWQQRKMVAILADLA